MIAHEIARVPRVQVGLVIGAERIDVTPGSRNGSTAYVSEN